MSHLITSTHHFLSDTSRVVAEYSLIEHNYMSPLFQQTKNSDNECAVEKIPENFRYFSNEWDKLFGDSLARAGVLFRGRWEEYDTIPEALQIKLSPVCPSVFGLRSHNRFFDGEMNKSLGNLEKIKKIDVLVHLDEAKEFTMLEKDRKNSTKEVYIKMKLLNKDKSQFERVWKTEKQKMETCKFKESLSFSCDLEVTTGVQWSFYVARSLLSDEKIGSLSLDWNSLEFPRDMDVDISRPITKSKSKEIAKLEGSVSFTAPVSSFVVVILSEFRHNVQEGTQNPRKWKKVVTTTSFLYASKKPTPFSVELAHQFNEIRPPNTSIIVKDKTNIIASLEVKYFPGKGMYWNSLKKMNEVKFECKNMGLEVKAKAGEKRKGFTVEINLGRQHVGYVLRCSPSPKLPDLYRIFQHSNFAPGGVLAAVCGAKMLWIASHADPRIMFTLSVVLNVCRICFVGSSLYNRQSKEMRATFDSVCSPEEEQGSREGERVGEEVRAGVGQSCELTWLSNHDLDCLEGFCVPSMGEKIDPLQLLGSVKDLDFDHVK